MSNRLIVHLKHPADSSAKASVTEDQVELYKSSGWVESQTPSSKPETKIDNK